MTEKLKRMRAPLKMKMIKAIIFDMDGVISDTQKWHSQIESKILLKHGIKIKPSEITRKYSGVKDVDMFKELFNQNNVKSKPEKASKEKWKEMQKKAEKKIPPIKGAKKLIKKLKSKGFKLAVASSSPTSFIQTVLKKLEIKQFDTIASSREVKNGKPHPDVFLLAARRLKIKPKECIVIEDGVNGMIAAKKAGMKCIAFSKSKNKPADLTVSQLEKITIEKIQKL